MRSFFFLIFWTVLVGQIGAQEPMVIRKEIVPLQSSRSDVERVAKRVKEFTSIPRYETDGEIIDVTYTRSKCLDHGWNVPPDRVLSYRVYPKMRVSLKDALNLVKSKFELTGDTFTSYYFDPDAGVVLVARAAHENIESIDFHPREADSGLRCKGYPPFSIVSSHYPPLGVFQIANPSNWDINPLAASLLWMKEKPARNGYLVIYCKKNQLNICRLLKKRIFRVFGSVFGANAKQPEVVIGGYRDSTEIETFLIPKGMPPPIAEPRYPADNSD